MGTWGTGIFANDLAIDVRDRYRALIATGTSDSEATDTVLAEWAFAVDDEEDGVALWLALAATQVALGRLEDRVRGRALAVIAAGADLERWTDDAPGEVAARRKVLEKLRTQLEGPQRAPRTIRKSRPMQARFVAGEIVAYTLDDGRSILLRAVGIHAGSAGDTATIMEVVDWIGRDAPDPAAIAALPALVRRLGDEEQRYWVPLVVGPSVKGRLSVVGRFDPPEPPTRQVRILGFTVKREQGWHLVYPSFLRWDALPDFVVDELDSRAGGR